MEGYEAPDAVHFARGPNAVNPRGREGFELEREQQLMLEAPPETSQPAQIEAPPQAQEEKLAGGILSSRTLAALQGAKVAVATKDSKPEKPSGPLVAYGSDDEEDE